MSDKLTEIKTDLAGHFRNWVNDPSNTARLQDKSFVNLGNFVSSDGVEEIKPLYRNFYFIGTWHLVHGFHNSFSSSEMDVDHIGQGVFCRFWGLMVCTGLRTSGLGPKAKMIQEDIVTFSALMTLGWEKQAKQFAHMALRMREAGEIEEPLPWEVLPKPQEMISILLMRDFLQIDWPLQFEPDLDKMGAYGALMKTWKDPDVRPFQKALNDAAERHIADCGYDDIRYSITQEDYWLWPVELLAVCRARILLNLPPARLEHPLFTATPLGQLPHPVAVPRPDPRIDEALRLFAKISNGAMEYPA